MTLEELLGFLFQASIFFIVFKLGTAANARSILFLFERPSLLLRSLLSMSIIMPACAVALAAVFDLRTAVKWALVTLAISPVPPFLPMKQINAGGSASYAISLLVVEALAAIVFVPGAVVLCGLIFQNDAHIGISTVMLIILATVLVPLALGMLVRHFAPNLAEQISDPVGRVGSVLLLMGLACVLLINVGGMVSLFGDGTIVAIVTFSVLGMVVGHALGGQNHAERAVLALASATRHPGIALAIVTANLPDHKLGLAAILLFVVVSIIVPIPYMRWIKPRIAAWSPNGDELV
jgi:bile acid:Na+ symporter, BASS family